jgi:pseudouridine kinase
MTAATQNDRLAIIGALHVDDIARSSSPLLSRASNPVSWERRLGGVAANAARAAAQCGIAHQTIELTAAVGDDLLSRSLSSALSACNVTANLQTMSGYATGRYTAIMDSDGELYIGLADVALAEQLASCHVYELSQSGPYSALLVDANLSAQCLVSMANLAIETATPLAALTVSPNKSLRLRPIAAHVDLLFCNRREAMALIANDDAAAELNDARYVNTELLADGLSELGFRQIVLSDAQAPILIQDNEGRYQIPVPTIKFPYTVNGAGDAMAGSCFAAWASGISLYDSVKHHGLNTATSVVRGELRAIAL